jgi:hypothetical protein
VRRFILMNRPTILGNPSAALEDAITFAGRAVVIS